MGIAEKTDEAVGEGGTVKRLILLGTGTSRCVPNIHCLTADLPTCRTCLDAAGYRPVENGGSGIVSKHNGDCRNDKPSLARTGRSIDGWIFDPMYRSPNRRGNTSLLVQYSDARGHASELRTILVDCGKSFYASALEFLAVLPLRRLEAVLLTHAHADATLGLDDLRHWTGHCGVQEKVDVYGDKETLEGVKETFPYLVDKEKATGSGDVSDIAFKLLPELEQDVSFDVKGLRVKPIKVQHGTKDDGTPYFALGFRFGKVAYISDASSVPIESMGLLEELDLLICDCLREKETFKSHFCLDDVRELVASIRPKRTILVGMAHSIDYWDLQRRLDAEYSIKATAMPDLCKIDVGYDGMTIDV